MTIDPNDLRRLVGEAPTEADADIDLSDMDPITGLTELRRAIDALEPGQSAWVHLSPAVGDGTPTLFQPVARALLRLRRSRGLARLVTREAGLGFWIQR